MLIGQAEPVGPMSRVVEPVPDDFGRGWEIDGVHDVGLGRAEMDVSGAL